MYRVWTLGLVVVAIASVQLTLYFNSPIASVLFRDVGTHLYRESIEWISSQGIVQGYSDGMFRPNKTVNRAEFTKIVTGITLPSSAVTGCTDSSFDDVPSNAWFAPYVCAAKKYGILSGYPDGTFRPGNPINFAEVAKIVVTAFEYNTSPGTPWYVPYTNALATRGVIPRSVALFDKHTTRGEVAELFYLLEHPPSIHSAASDQNRDTNVSLALMNQVRQEYGLHPFTLDPLLSQAAENHATDLETNGYYSHTSLDGRSTQQRIQATGYGDIDPNTCNCSTWGLITGENIFNLPVSPEEVVAIWLDSPKHRANILSKDFRDIGITRVGSVWVLTFGLIIIE